MGRVLWPGRRLRALLLGREGLMVEKKEIEKMMKIGEVAEYFGVSIATVRRYFKLGIRVRRGTRTVDVRLHAYHFGRQTLRFKPEDVRAFEEAAKEKE
jgi:hypothetical protein